MKKTVVLQDALEIIKNIGDCGDIHECDVRSELFNNDGKYIYRIHCTNVLNDFDVFDAISVIQGYEKSNYGDCYTDFGNPYRVANTLLYIAGETILDEFWNWLETNYKIERPEMISEIENIDKLAREFYNECIDNWGVFEKRMINGMFAWVSNR